MMDYSDMPGLVDPPAGQRQYAGTPYVFPAAPPGSTPGTPWPNAGVDPGLAWGGAFNAQSQVSSPPWPPHPATPWPAAGAAYVMAPAMYPAPTNPAMPSSRGDGWVRPAEDDPGDRQAAGYFAKRDEEGWSSARSMARPLTPFSSSNTSSPASMSSGISRSRSVRSLGGESNMRPPREWRVDFSMSRAVGRGSSLGSILTKARSASISGSLLDSSKLPKLHPYLRYTSSAPSMHLDLRLNPSTVRFRVLDREVNNWDLMRFVCEPPVSDMRLYSVYYPWYIDVVSNNPTGVTIHELFSAIWLSMTTPIRQEDYWNNEVNGVLRDRIAYAWADRCEDEEERKKGIRRVDFLLDRVMLEGLVKGKDGMWEMKIKKP